MSYNIRMCILLHTDLTIYGYEIAIYGCAKWLYTDVVHNLRTDMKNVRTDLRQVRIWASSYIVFTVVMVSLPPSLPDTLSYRIFSFLYAVIICTFCFGFWLRFFFCFYFLFCFIDVFVAHLSVNYMLYVCMYVCMYVFLSVCLRVFFVMSLSIFPGVVVFVLSLYSVFRFFAGFDVLFTFMPVSLTTLCLLACTTPIFVDFFVFCFWYYFCFRFFDFFWCCCLITDGMHDDTRRSFSG